MSTTYREIIILDGQDRTGPAIASAIRNLTAFRSQANSIGGMVLSPVVRLVDMATAPLRAIGSAINGVAEGLAGIGLASFGLEAVVGLLERMSAVFTGPLGLVDFLTRADIGFTTMLGSASAAQAFMDKITTFAIKTPFSVQNLVQESQFMLAMGTAADQVIPRLTIVGDAVSALGGTSENIHNVMRALLQMESMGRVNAHDMLALTRNNIDAWNMLAKGMHMSIAEVRDLSEQGLLESGKSVEILLKAMSDRFHGQMEQNANRTLLGLKEQIVDTFNMRVVAKWGEGLFQEVLPVLQNLNMWLIMNADVLTQIGLDAISAGAAIAGVFSRIANFAIRALHPVYEAVRAIFIGFTSNAGAFGIVGDIIEKVFGKGAASMVRPFLQSIMDIARLLQHGQLETALVALPGRVVRAFREVGARVLGMLRGGGNWFAGLSTMLGPVVDRVLNDIRRMAFGVANELGLGSQLGAALNWLTHEGWPWLLRAVQDVTAWLDDNVIPVLRDVWTWLAERLSTVLAALPGAWTAFKDALSSAWTWIDQNAIPIAQRVYNWLQFNIGSAVQYFVQYLWPAFRDAALAAWTWLQDNVPKIAAEVYRWLNEKIGVALSWLIDTGWPFVRDAASNAWEKIRASADANGPTIYDWLTAKIGVAVGWLIAYGFPTLGESGADAFAAIRRGADLMPKVLDRLRIPQNLLESWENLKAIVHDITILFGPRDKNANSLNGAAGLFNDVARDLTIGWVGKLFNDFAKFAQDLRDITAGIRSVLDRLVELDTWIQAHPAIAAVLSGNPLQGYATGRAISGGATPGGPNYPTSTTTPGGTPTGAFGASGPAGLPVTTPPAAAHGAVVWGDTLMRVGEDAPLRPEVVAPLDTLAGLLGGGGRGGDVHIHLPDGLISLTGAAGDDMETLATRLAGPLARVIARELVGGNPLAGELAGA